MDKPVSVKKKVYWSANKSVEDSVQESVCNLVCNSVKEEIVINKIRRSNDKTRVV